MTASIRWQVVDASNFASLAARWDALNEAGFRSPVLHSDFVAPLLTHFGDGSQRIAFVEDAGRWRRACIVTKTNAFVHDTFQPSQAPIGLWLQDDGANGLPDAATLSALAAALGSTTAMVGLNQLDPELVARPVGGEADSQPVTSDYIDTARVTIAGSFDDYWAARGKNLRANMKKQRNKLDSEGVALRFDCLTAVSDVAAAIVDYGRLESAGWKASGGTAVSADNEQGRFYRDVFERFAARGKARIYRCFYGQGFDERVAAMDLCIEHDGVMVILKTAFDESIRGTSPAFLMRHDYFPAVFAEGRLKRIEFYGRVMEWHTKWSEEVRTLYHATTYRWPVVARLDALRRARSARSALRAVTSEATATATTAEAATNSAA
jgi:CelD/BcsL family acetyltransferase involved in cellulose biosynthesis